MLLRITAAAICAATVLLLITTSAFAYSRPDAVSLSASDDGTWQVLATKPLVELVKDRVAKPDFPALAPTLEQAIPSYIRGGMGLPREGVGDWQAIAVPAAWEQTLGVDYNGAGWYRRTLSVPLAWAAGPTAAQRRIWLEFDSVATVAGVWVNGKWCGGNVGDYVRWRVDITDAVRSALPKDAGLGSGEALGGELKASLLVYVDELPGHITQGFPSMIGPHYGGLWQDCRMYSSGAASIEPDGVRVQVNPATGETEVDCRLAGATDGKAVPRLLVMAHHAGRAMDESIYTSPEGAHFLPGLSADGSSVFKFQLDRAKLSRWSPEQPDWYELRFELRSAAAPDGVDGLLDSVRQRFAVRSIDTRGYQLRLNDQPLYLKSALNWGWYPGAIAPLPSPDTVRDEFKQLKALGFNAETVCLTVMPDYFYDIADEEGVLLWQEYPAWHNKVTPALSAEYQRLYERFYRRDAGHPSVILRSLTCENGETDEGVMKDLLALGRRLTDTPLQDNTSWIAMSRPALTDWFDEHNYFNCSQWVKYTLDTLPGKLSSMPDKPFLIGESILFNTWPDTGALLENVGSPLVGTKGRTSATPTGTSTWPYWFPKCFDSVLGTEVGLRARYNALLPRPAGGVSGDIVHDYLLPQSYAYSLASRRFQMSLLHASPRYAGYTMNVVRDMPLIRAGLLDDLGRPRWTAKDWAWQTDQTSKVQLEAAGKITSGSKDDLLAWNPQWDREIDRSVPVMIYGGSGGAGSPARQSVAFPPVRHVGKIQPKPAPKPTPTPKPPPAEPTPADPRATPDRNGPPAPAQPAQPAQPVAPSTPAPTPDPGPPAPLVRPTAPKAKPLPAPLHSSPSAPATTAAYRDIAPWFKDWQDAQPVAPGALKDADPLKQHSPVVVTSVLTTELADFAQRGGVVVLCTSKWPGALGSYPHFFWRDSIFIPPVGPWGTDITGAAPPPAGQRATDRVVQLQPYDLNLTSGDVIPVQDLGITDNVDPLLRLFDTHDLSTVVTYDQLFATRVGSGLLIASSLDHSTQAGQWVLSKVLAWSLVWKLRAMKGEPNAFPATELSAAKLADLSVGKANGILDINAGWRFSTDPKQTGEAQGWAKPEFDDKAWMSAVTGQSWEALLGQEYDGMGWYRRKVTIPADWAGGKVRLVCEGVDDAYGVWVNGRKVNSHGSFTDHEQTVWQEQTVSEISSALRPGEENTIALQVVDITGQGGVWKPVYLTLE